MSSDSRRFAMPKHWIEIILGVVVVALVVALIVVTTTGDDDSDTTGNTAVSEDDGDGIGPLGDHARRDEGDPLAMGDVDAPVVLLDFSDFRCPFCAKFSQETKPELIEDYVDSGKLRIEWHDLPIFGEESELAARAGRAAAEQDTFWEFNKAVYEDAPQSGHPDMDEEKLRGFAEEAGVPDLDQFTEQMNSDEFDADIQKDMQLAQSLGASSTPTFVLNGYPLVGAQPTPKFTGTIDLLLERAGEDDADDGDQD